MIIAPTTGQLHPHWWALADYAAFYFGMMLFVLRRADLAMHAKNNALLSKRQYFSLNWVVLLIRAMMQSPLLYIWQHYTWAQILGWFNVGWAPPITIPNIPIVAALLGYFSYTLMDWLIAKRAPAWVREQIPSLPSFNGSQFIQEKP